MLSWRRWISIDTHRGRNTWRDQLVPTIFQQSERSLAHTVKQQYLGYIVPGYVVHAVRQPHDANVLLRDAPMVVLILIVRNIELDYNMAMIYAITLRSPYAYKPESHRQWWRWRWRGVLSWFEDEH